MANDKKKAGIFFLVAFLYGVYSFIFGQSGLLERSRLQNEKLKLDRHVVYLEKENQRLIQILTSYRTGTKLKEEAEKSGYIEKNSKIIFFKKPPATGEEQSQQYSPIDNANKDKIQIEHLRIFWIVISILIILFYLIVKNKTREISEEK